MSATPQPPARPITAAADGQPVVWDQQRIFRQHLQADARALAALLDGRLDPRVAIVGVALGDATNPPVIVEQENLVIDAPALARVRRDLLGRLPEARWAQAADILTHAPRPTDRAELMGVAAAFRDVLVNSPNAADRLLILGPPVVVNGYATLLVVHVDAATYRRHVTPTGLRAIAAGATSSSGSSSGSGTMSRHHAGANLLDQSFGEFLRYASQFLFMPKATAVANIVRRDPLETLLAGARGLLSQPAWLDAQRERTGELLHALNLISATRYESEDCTGRLVICDRHDAGVKEHLRFLNPIDLHNAKAVRKLLEVTRDNGVALLTDGFMARGYGELAADATHGTRQLFVVKFLGNSTWELWFRHHAAMRVSYGRPMLPVPDIQHAELAKRLRDVFPEARPADLDHLTTLVLSFSRINHGALLVVTENAASEAERLAAQAIGVDPTVLHEHMLAGIGRIDGAVLIDPTGRVHAFGAILDGKVKRESRGNTSRGARYNSARRYVEDQVCRCMALVISEDGMIDFLAGKGDQGGAFSTITRAIR